MKKINKSISVLLVLLGVMLMGTSALAIDTDGDGVDNSTDIDSDNDGILNAIEIQGGGLCSYGFFHAIDGQLNIVDIVNEPLSEDRNRQENI